MDFIKGEIMSILQFDDVMLAAIYIMLSGMVIYGVALVMAFIFNLEILKTFKQSIQTNLIFSLGLPVAGLSSFSIVAIYLSVFPPDKVGEGEVSIRFLGMDFSGPSGPITLWLVCFLGIVFSMKLFTKPESKS
jgi:hypothetical protein